MSEKTKLLNEHQALKRINDLIANSSSKKSKYTKSYALYNQCPGDSLRAAIPNTVGLLDDIYSDETLVPKLNVIKSAVDSVVSKMATAHCRPFVNAIKGSFKTIQICKQLQVFFDYYFDEQKIGPKIVDALRDACVFDTGYIYFKETTGDVLNVQPWNVYTRQQEKADFKSCFIEFPSDSIDNLDEEVFELLSDAERECLYITHGYFYDMKTRTKGTVIGNKLRKIEELQSSEIPLVAVHYTSPINGNTCLSITDMLRGIQAEIDNLMQRIAEASVLNPAQTIFIPNGTNIKVGQLNNKIGNVVQYSTPQGGQPVTVSTPSFISDQYMALLDSLIEKAYNMVGISQLSAMGKKPAGLDSGVALATQSDIESDRFQVLLDQYIGMHTDVAKKAVKLFKSTKDIIKPNRYNLRLSWGDVEKEWEKMRIQFSGADSLSKDPSEKLKQLQALAQAGIIPATQIAALMEIPDINRGYSIANNAYNATMTLIDQCIYEDKFEVPEYVPFPMLKEQIVNMELSLRAAATDGKNDKDIEKLQKYYDIVEDEEQKIQGGIQGQANAQDVTQNNAYSAQNNEEFGNGTENELNMQDEGIANPYDTGADNGGELDSVSAEG